MKKQTVMLGAVCFLALSCWAQSGPVRADAKDKTAESSAHAPGVLSAQELKQVMPAAVFFRGQTAPVQVRNSGGVRSRDGRLVLIGMVDSSGYSTGVAQKYQAYLLSEVSLRVEGKVLPPGAYGVGFLENDSFNVMDIGANDVIAAPGHTDATLRRAVPLKIVTTAGGAFRLYFGKHYVEFTVPQ